MPQAKPLPDRKWLLEQLRYEPETGLFWWRRSGSGRRTDRAAGAKVYGSWAGEPDGIAITIKGVIYRAHRLAWLMMTGEDPKELTIDHVNRDPFDNRFANLRLADAVLQNRNQKPRGQSAYKGVCPNGDGRWRAHRKLNGRMQRLGTFATEEEAAAVAAPYYIH